MEFTLDRKILAEAVAWTARSLPSRPTSPILGGIRITASGGRVQFTAFDLDTMALETVDADRMVDGSVVVGGRMLADVCKALPADEIKVTQADNRLVFASGRAKYTFGCMNTEGMPTLPQPPPSSGRTEAATLAGAVSQVSLAVARDDTLPLLASVLLHAKDDTLTLAATDRYRFAVKQIPWEPFKALDEKVLIRGGSLANATKTLTDGTVEIGFPGSAYGLAGFTYGSRRGTWRVIDGQFPEWDRLFPSEFQTTVVLDRTALLQAVQRLTLVSQKNMPVRLMVDTVAGEMSLSAAEADTEGQEIVDGATDGKPIMIGFNPGYLADALSNLGQPSVRLRFTEPNKPAVMQGIQDDGEVDPTYKYLMMPIRMSDPTAVA